MAFAFDVFNNFVFQMYPGQKPDEHLSHWGNAVGVHEPIKFKGSLGVVDIWSDGRCYSPATDSYVRPINTSGSKSQGFPF